MVPSPDEYSVAETISVLQRLSRGGVGEPVRVADLVESETDREPYHLLAFLGTLNLLDFDQGDDGEWRVIIREQAQRYFVESLTEYLKHDLSVFRSWEEGRKNMITPANVFYGTQFLHYLERERKETLPTPRPLREATVVKAVIKAKFAYRRQPRYLFEYHRKSEQAKLLGGLVEKSDTSRRKALAREIDEEIPGLSLELGTDYYLKHLNGFEQEVVSFTYGAYAVYDVHYYLIDFAENGSIDVTDQNAWVTIDEIRDGRSRDGHEIFPLQSQVVDLMERQPYSIKVPARFDPVAFVRSYWQELVGLISTLSFLFVLLRFIL